MPITELSSDELLEAQKVVDKYAANIGINSTAIVAKILFGHKWERGRDVHGYGIRLKATVRAGDLSGIVWHPKDTPQHAAQYVIRGRGRESLNSCPD